MTSLVMAPSSAELSLLGALGAQLSSKLSVSGFRLWFWLTLASEKLSFSLAFGATQGALNAIEEAYN